jgi:hypothetical protein
MILGSPATIKLTKTAPAYTEASNRFGLGLTA